MLDPDWPINDLVLAHYKAMKIITTKAQILELEKKMAERPFREQTSNTPHTHNMQDCKNYVRSFLNGDLEEAYMEIPLGLETKTNINKVCKLKKINKINK